MEWVGYLAAICTTGAFIPQVLHTIKTKNTQGISLAMYVIFVFGVFLWLLYGLDIGEKPIIVANSVTLFFAAIILLMKLRDVMRKK